MNTLLLKKIFALLFLQESEIISSQLKIFQANERQFYFESQNIYVKSFTKKWRQSIKT